MDLSKPAIAGHSFGSATVLRTLNADKRFKWTFRACCVIFLVLLFKIIFIKNKQNRIGYGCVDVAAQRRYEIGWNYPTTSFVYQLWSISDDDQSLNHETIHNGRRSHWATRRYFKVSLDRLAVYFLQNVIDLIRLFTNFACALQR